MSARINRIAKAIDNLKAQRDEIAGDISGDKARRMYLTAEWIAHNLKTILFRTNGWRE